MDVWVLLTAGWESQDIEILGVFQDPEVAKKVAEEHFEKDKGEFFQRIAQWQLVGDYWWYVKFAKGIDYHGYNIYKHTVGQGKEILGE